MSDQDLKKELTPELLYKNRRLFLKTSIFSTATLATYGLYRVYRPQKETLPQTEIEIKNSDVQLIPTSEQKITNYNNFYEFSTNKEKVAELAKSWQVTDWNLKIEGLVKNPISLNLNELRDIKTEERVYRFRCVEGWSMVVPWLGFEFNQLLQRVQPLPEAKYVAFESFFDPEVMPGARTAGISFPYIEGLRLDEAQHPLTFMAMGLYKKNLPPQNGSPLRLVVPWKYGFKNIKSIHRIVLTDTQPQTTWNLAAPEEYGFYANVNPDVDHPRWSQKQERRLGEFSLRPTEIFNGYEKEVASLYAGMDLTKNF